MAHDPEPESVVGCGCFVIVALAAFGVYSGQPVATFAHWVNWLPIQLLTSILAFYSVFFLIVFPIPFGFALITRSVDDDLKEHAMQGGVIVPISCGLLYLTWMSAGAETYSPTKELPEFQSVANTNIAQLGGGVYIFECPNSILGQSHWGIWIPDRGGFELSGEESWLTRAGFITVES